VVGGLNVTRLKTVTLTPESRGALPVVGGEGVLEADAARGVNLQLNTMT
jgi:hypothetical protein